MEEKGNKWGQTTFGDKKQKLGLSPFSVPGVRAGQLHYPDQNNVMYLYDPATNTFMGASKSVNKLLE